MKNIARAYSTLILAGGNSARMGSPKPWLQYDPETTYLKQIVDLYAKAGVERITVVLNETFCLVPWLEKLNQIEMMARVVRNPNPEKGRLYSLFLGLQDIDDEKILIHNVDNPFVESSVIEALISQSGNEDVTIPCCLGQSGHPVIINAAVKHEIIHAYKKFNSLKELFSGFNKKYVAVDSSSILKNINTPMEYQTSYGYL